MTRVTEKQLILPALLLISKSDKVLNTSDLIKKLEEELKPTGDDLEILKNRKDTKFSQKVRNLVAHDTLRSPGYVKYLSTNPTRFEITPKGTAYIQPIENNVMTLMEFGLDVSSTAMEEISEGNPIQVIDDREIIEGELTKRTVEYRKRSKQLRNAAYQHYSTNGRIICVVCKFEFAMAYPVFGPGYIQIHHLQPVSFMTGEPLNLTEALENVRPLCANCHQIVHSKRPPLSMNTLKRDLRVSYYYKSSNNY